MRSDGKTAVFVLAGALFLGPALAAGPGEAELEQRVNQLSEQLRCLVCQNQSVAESHAELAQDLKNQVREQLRGGRSEAEVVDFMVQRYGDFVLYRPPVKPATWVLWVGPFVLLAAALAGLIVRLRRRARNQPNDLDDKARAKAAALLGEGKTS